ncbi:constitutive coactivator of PPAR-gamma-like protein 1 homolog isoform X1 [Osmia lignaria lignaria]|uniref:constitutive coactivator of PPAR-gamma-like protein 1 homolog isoform X1 n=1 Tax=Osmia lignaria lignaria TaxID=1437193 RepID=UPI0014783075|nr:constitutive coactivator of PPAR-gamma-like protein 1 homolog isoform X1 [Osmia lignaria]XP_034185252.1 constitutive coactivator of PPAR-gamma-like protein 1 homolog isoform X1 [Osmia lignaria]XP_034185253.1 constitutive coactivator of PPAR-gamma-like protein 1 homolog isoform X1 [Osmia lignaria]
MGIQDLQVFLDGNFVQGGSVPVDLLKIARTVIQRQHNRIGKTQQLQSGKLRLVLDGECCLDRLYGGYFSDWACGGQWNRMLQFLVVLIHATEASRLELAVFFNGCFESPRRADWIQNQLQVRIKVNNVLKHISTKGTPPPKIWWTPPVCLRTSLRMALRHLNVTVLCSMDDHHQEVIAYCRENNFNGLIADDAEYAAFDPPRYFSSEQLKLTYKGSLDTKEYILPDVLKSLNIPSDRLCLLAALLGNYILTETDLADFYKKLNVNASFNKVNVEHTIKTIANYVRDLPSVEPDVVAQKVFGSLSDPRCSKLRQSVQYYINGTKEGFLHYKPVKPNRDVVSVHKIDSKQNVQQQSNLSETPSTSEVDSNLETSRFASETVESERESLNAYKQATANAKSAPQIVIDPPGLQGHGDADNIRSEDEQSNGHAINGTHNLLISSSSSSSSSSATSPSHATADSGKQGEKITNIPTTVPEVMRTASERHQKGLMSPHIYQILIAGEIKLPVLLEDENHREFPSIHLIYRPVRQMVYAILFNLHHRMYLAAKSKEKGDSEKIEVPDVVIKEWVWSKSNPYQTPELVKAEQIGWGVPTIQRLWFGTGIDDKRRRLRGFLTCMRSDTPLMLNTSYVPQHLLVMACVLRYIMSFSDKIKILRRQELDAFIAQAFSPELMNAQYLQDLQLPLVTSRGVQLATLFMTGVETALLANDACGAPIPWLMCCPWLYFDGKLFHHTLARTMIAKNLLELCSGYIDRVVKVERMRKAVLEGINVIYARTPLPVSRAIPVSVPQNILSGTMPQRGLMRRPIPSRGGQLEIAGVVVGQWGPNYGQPGRLPQPLQGHIRGRIPPQVTSIGGLKYGLPRGFNPMGRPTFQTRGTNRTQLAGRGKKTQMKATGKKKATVKKNKENEKKENRGRGNNIDGITDYNDTIPNMNATKDALPVPGQFEDAVENSKGIEKGQGDASLVVPVVAEN